MILTARVWSGRGHPPPGRLEEVPLRVERLEGGALLLPGLTVRHDGDEELFERADLRFDPRRGGGPTATPEHRRDALAFGVVNTAHHLSRALARATELLGRPLPPLVAVVGAHAARHPGWGGGHYRLPAESYSTLPEEEPPVATGEIHLGAGGRLVPLDGRAYLHTASHDPAIVYHEFGHHLVHHTADLRCNRRRAAGAQTNRRIPLDEGTCDYIAAILMGTPDIYGWHRAGVPSYSARRRRLDAPRTMAHFVGGHLSDPHADGAIWSAALWAARCELERGGVDPGRFDAVVLRSLERIGRSGDDLPVEVAQRRRRRFATALEAILAEDEAGGGDLATVVETVFAARGIEVGTANNESRWRARGGLPAGIAVGS
ncbi:MAG TPA: hypothetical protein VGL20_21345 [Candidatus Dormibacteraeota bacterium]